MLTSSILAFQISLWNIENGIFKILKMEIGKLIYKLFYVSRGPKTRSSQCMIYFVNFTIQFPATVNIFAHYSQPVMSFNENDL